MTNFIFKSPSDLQKISQSIMHQFDVIQKEQRHQRSDLQVMHTMLLRLVNNDKLQKTVDEYYSTPPVDEEQVIHPKDEQDLD